MKQPGGSSAHNNIMKTINKVLILSVVAVAMATVSSAKADGALLTPRAKGNQIITVPATANDQSVAVNPNSGANSGIAAAELKYKMSLLSPRARGNQIVKVAGTNNDPDLVAGLQSQYGTPKALQQSMPVYQIAPVK